MTAWQLLTASSLLSSGTAWQRLNNIESGGGVVIYGEAVAEMMADIESDIEQQEIAAEIETRDYAAMVEPELGSEIE